MKQFILAVIAGVVATALYRNYQQQPSPSDPASPQRLGVNLGIVAGLPTFKAIAAPSGHGDATQNATGTPTSTVGSGYAPALGANENQGAYLGVYLR